MAVQERSLSTDREYFIRSTTGVHICLRPLHLQDAVGLRPDLVAFSSGLLGVQLFPYFSVPDEKGFRELTEEDADNHGGWLALTPGGSRPRTVGIGRWARSQSDPETGEAGIAVVDGWRLEGIGTALLALVVRDATEHRMSLLRIPVWASASMMRQPLEALGARLGPWEGGRLIAELPLPVRRRALERLADHVSLKQSDGDKE